TMTPEEASAVFSLILRVLTLPIVLAAAVMALFASPLMRIVEKIFSSKEHLDFGEAYKATYKAIYAWALTTFVAGFVVYILGYLAPSIFLFPARIILGFVHTITGPDTLHLFTLPQILLTLALLQVPALAAFAWMLRRTSEHRIFAGPSGFAKSLLTAIALLPVTGLLALISFGLLFKLANTFFHFA
ncbi:MAG TPA: hypothetical protein VG714_07120, partial [Acidobacteriaceae bacterium]|nr:hypothetical protein [Acidobacteriaceae bacterium]